VTKQEILDRLDDLDHLVRQEPGLFGLGGEILGDQQWAWRLQEGSPSAGLAWRLHWTALTAEGRATGGESTPDALGLPTGWPNSGYLGWTKREAYVALGECMIQASRALREIGSVIR